MVKDPYRYFRVEARELLEGLGAGVLALEKGAGSAEVVGRLLRLAHTLKGASRVVKQAKIAELAHALEDVLSPHRQGAAALPRDQVDAILKLLDAIGEQVVALDPAVPARDGASRTEDERFETVRVEISELDALLESVAEAGVRLTALRRELEALPRAHRLAAAIVDQLSLRFGVESGASVTRVRSIAEELMATLDGAGRTVLVGLEQAEREVLQVREQAGKLRLLRARTIFPALERAVRDAAESVDKRVELETAGGDGRLDAHVLAALHDALLHVVRNAVAHGIEKEAERVAAGKPPVGRVWLDVERQGHRIVFTCRDDGRGIDPEAVRRAAVDRGLVSAAEARALDGEAVLRLILRTGVTTAGAVTAIAGRGVGLDVLRSTVARLKGEVVIRSELRKGTTIALSVPISLSSMAVLVVEAGGSAVSLPLDSVRQLVQREEHEIASSADGQSILWEGNVVPFLPLSRALRRSSARAKAATSWSTVIVQSGSRLAAVGVDRLLGTANMVVRPLPMTVDPIAVIAGASLDADGDPQLVVDPTGLVEALHARWEPAASPVAVTRAPILVIDDSLTTRMLEQSILESAGYEVEVATSAEEGLVKARERRYSLFVVDVEMPGMDGFEFVELTRRDAVLRETPAILVTSRNAVEDRRRGEEVGARAYIVKGEFDQGRLLETIQTLVG